VFPDSEHNVASYPWTVDLQPRLIRAVPGLVRSRGRILVEPEAVGAQAIVDAPFISVAALRHPLTSRRTWPSRDLQIGFDVPLWSRETAGRLAVPEDGGVQTAQLPQIDADTVGAFLDAIASAVPASTRPPAAGAPFDRAATVEAREIDDYLIEVPDPAVDHGAEVKLLTPLPPVEGGQRCLLLVEVKNTGTGTWPAGADGWPPVCVGARWTAARGDPPPVSPRAYFTERVLPDTTTRLLVCAVAPEEPGVYQLSVSVVYEMVRWLEPAASQEVTVVSSPQGVVGSLDALALAGRRLRRRQRVKGRREIFADDLRRLNDALSETAFAHSYWVWGGMLLGWAREGRLLESDLFDADCAFVAGEPSFEQAVQALVTAGFEPRARFCTNQGEPYEWRFVANDAQFEFFAMTPINGRFRYQIATFQGPALAPPNIARAEIAAQRRVPFAFLDRTWLKSEDHEQELTAIYDDWRTPHPEHWWMTDRAIVSREPWYRTTADWDGAPRSTSGA
jgi:hypothetical protein